MTASEEPSTLSFIGTVDSVTDQRGSTGEGQRSAEVRVEEVVGAPAALGSITGTTVVVLLPEHSTVTPGQRHLFHTVGASYGATITVRAIEVAPAEDAQPRRGKPGLNQRLATEVGRADAIVVGEIVRLGEPETSSRLTEHDPQIATAVIRVDETLAGAPQPVAEVALPTSSDVMWATSTNPREGDVAVFLLGPAAPAAGAGPAHEVIAVYPVEALDDIRSAVGQQ